MGTIREYFSGHSTLSHRPFRRRNEQGKQKLPVLTYIAGYFCYFINKKLKSADCNEQIVSSSGNVDDFQITMTKDLSREGLLYPTQDVIDEVLVCYLIIKKLSESFYTSSLQCKLAIITCLAVLDGECMMNSGHANFCTTHGCSELSK